MSDSPYQRIVENSLSAIALLRDLEEEVTAATNLMIDSLKRGGKVLACGNGGSAADSAHFTTELLCRFVSDRKSLAALALTNDGSFLTAVANDYDYDRVFARQIEGLGKPEDVLLGISTSGNSGNVLEAFREAKEMDLKTIALLGRDGGRAKGIADVDIIVPHELTARIQEGHKVLIHAFCALIEKELFGIDVV